jgi:hypothetical protein
VETKFTTNGKKNNMTDEGVKTIVKGWGEGGGRVGRRRVTRSLDDHNPDHINPRGDDNGDVYVDCDNIIQVFMNVSIAVFWVVISYNFVGVAT